MNCKKQIRLPELEALWKWPRQVSPHLSEVAEESLEWCSSLNAFDANTQKLVHDKGKLSKLAALTPPYIYPLCPSPDVSRTNLPATRSLGRHVLLSDEQG